MGLSTKIYDTETFPVPNEWIFEKFLNLPEPLTGQSVSIKSIFNSSDSKPSMVLYLNDKNVYKFKCFSTGLFGDGVDIIQFLYKLKTRQEAHQKVYDFWKSGNHEIVTNTIVKTNYKISSIVVREWNQNDVSYWSKYKIGSKELNHHNIKPLESYKFIVTKGHYSSELNFGKEYCYGYYNNKNEIYKIYNPTDIKKKFIKIKNYIQGEDQLEYKSNWLLILASMKDLIVFKKLNFPIECIAPDSENTMISKQKIEYYKTKYKFICVLFDNDPAGENAASKYKKYDIPSVDFNIEKDVAECVKHHGLKNSRLFLKKELIKIKKQFNK